MEGGISQSPLARLLLLRYCAQMKMNYPGNTWIANKLALA